VYAVMKKKTFSTSQLQARVHISNCQSLAQTLKT